MAIKSKVVQPVISEKSYRLAQDGIYTFYVDSNVSKPSIADAVSKQFKVTVTNVRTVTIPGKRVRFGKTRISGRRSDKKKALVTLKDGDKISIFEV
jgi:large subunit ribosomal protein L23